jgi:predicted hotdog family 3-hydroxylacyl-ACP dehydratase
MSRKALIRGGRILDYIPQRRPMVMVDTFYGVEGDASYSGFTVPAEGVFCHGGLLDECALIENMAQSAALRVGWLCATEGRPVPLGFIGSVGRCDIARRARTGERLRTRVRVTAEVDNVTMAEVEVAAGTEKICTATLKIFLQQ